MIQAYARKGPRSRDVRPLDIIPSHLQAKATCRWRLCEASVTPNSLPTPANKGRSGKKKFRGPRRTATGSPGQHKHTWVHSLTADPSSPPLSTPVGRADGRAASAKERLPLCQTGKKFEDSRTYFLKKWQNSWETKNSSKTTQTSFSLTPKQERLRMHEGLANAESSLAPQILTKNISLANFLHRQLCCARSTTWAVGARKGPHQPTQN